MIGGAVDGAGIVVAGLRKGVGSPCCWHESRASTPTTIKATATSRENRLRSIAREYVRAWGGSKSGRMTAELPWLRREM